MKILPKKKDFYRLLFFSLSCLIFLIVGLIYRLSNYVKPVQAQQVPTQCIGEALADYMNEVVAGAGNLSKIRLLSPAFNLTNPAEIQIFDAMVASGANFAGLDGFAGNTYTISGVRAVDWYLNNWASRFTKPVIFTEFGDFRTGDFPIGTNRQFLIGQMRDEYIRAVGNSNIRAAIYFSVLNYSVYGGNDDFLFHNLTDQELQTVTSAGGGKAGANSAMGIDGSGTFSQNLVATGANLDWTLEIINGPGDLGGAIDAISAAQARGFTPVLRLCVGASCGFSDPASLVGFLNSLNNDPRVSADIWVIAGPNEPATENWAAPLCGNVQNPTFPTSNTTRQPCNTPGQDIDENFHSLRPFPGSPCNQAIQQTALLCGHDVIVRERFEVLPADATSCDPIAADGSQTCYYEYENTVNVQINLDDAELPIMGNTQLVPSLGAYTPTFNGIPQTVISQDGGFTSAQRVNEYVSWYLNGVNYRAEEAYPFDLEPDIKKIIDFSGPLNKLLPWRVQIDSVKSGGSSVASRNKQIDDANASISGANIRHDQIVGCFLNAFLQWAYEPIHCYNILESLPFPGRLRTWLSAYIVGNSKPPVEENYTNIQDYYSAYRGWRGGGCTRLPVTILGKQLMVCFNQGIGGTYFAQFYPYIPYSSTEDRKGIVEAIQGQTPLQIEGNVEVTNVEWVPEQATDLLYFAHMEENTQLAHQLQDTFAPYDPAGTNTFNEPQPPLPYLPPRCEILNSRTNPGDDLLGEWADFPEEQMIEGNITYSARFTCVFRTQFDQGLYDTCIAAGRTDAECQLEAQKTDTCKKDGMTALSPHTHTPLAWEVWQRLVAGDMGVFKRWFPKVEEDEVGPLRSIEEIPARTRASYMAEHLSGSLVPADTDTLAGQVFNYRPGTNAELYFPYLGGVHEYFLTSLQDALRPQGAGQVIPGQVPPVNSQVNCNQNLPDSTLLAEFPTATNFLGAFKQRVIDVAEAWLTDDIPGSNNAEECYNDVVLRSLRAGVNPAFTLAIWLNESDASNYDALPMDLQDFGINVGSIARNFDAQITRFLQLTQPNTYSDLYPQCFANSYTKLQNFMYIFSNGTANCVDKQPPADLYYFNNIFGSVGAWNFITNCPIPEYMSPYPSPGNSCP